MNTVPKYALAQQHIGARRLPEAEKLLRQVVAVQPRFVDGWDTLCRLFWHQNRPAEALTCVNKILGIKEDAHAYNNRAVLKDILGQHDGIVADLERSIELDPEFVEGHIHYAMALLARGHYEVGWREYEWRLRTPERLRHRPPAPRWNGERLIGMPVVIYAEQGCGDTLQFARFIPEAAKRGVRPFVVVRPSLRRLIGSFGFEIVTENSLLPAFHLTCPLLSLPRALDVTTPEMIRGGPYLAADPGPWRDFLDQVPRLRVGLVWAGQSRPGAVGIGDTDSRRSMRLEDLAPLFSVPGVSWVSLQLGEPARQMQEPPVGVVARDAFGAAAPDAAGVPLYDVSARLQDWSDTASLISGLGLVISVDTAVAHLAGALGKPVWVLNRLDSFWPFGISGETTPWYPSMRIYRQLNPNDWTVPISRVARDLRTLSHQVSLGI